MSEPSAADDEPFGIMDEWGDVFLVETTRSYQDGKKIVTLSPEIEGAPNERTAWLNADNCDALADELKRRATLLRASE